MLTKLFVFFTDKSGENYFFTVLTSKKILYMYDENFISLDYSVFNPIDRYTFTFRVI